MDKKKHLLVPMSLLALYFIWGSTFIAIKFAIESIPPFMSAGLRFLFAGVLLYALLRIQGTPSPSRTQWKSTAAIGTLLLAVGNGGVTFAEQWIASGPAALAIATVPIWALLFSGIWGEYPHRREWLGIGLGLLGVLLLNLGGNMQASPIGATVLLVAAAGWAFGSLWSKRLDMPSGPMSSAAQMLFAGSLLMIISGLSGERLQTVPSARSLWALGYLVIFGSFIAYSAYLYLLKTVRPAIATSYAFVNPMVAMLLGSLLSNEKISGFEILALLAILSGVVLVLMEKKG